jgi:hypothetical protein
MQALRVFRFIHTRLPFIVPQQAHHRSYVRIRSPTLMLYDSSFMPASTSYFGLIFMLFTVLSF